MKKAQVISEWVLLATVVLAALVAMQVYVKRGLSSRYKTFVDAQKEPFGLTQYEPYYQASNYTVTQDSRNLLSKYSEGRTYIIVESTTRAGNVTQGVNLTQDDNWNW